jgi:cytochrome c biogenesis protein CcdA
MDIIFSASIIAAFFAGMVALFAPCCITVLLPAYLASAFREKRNILKMTFVFFAGIAVIIIPIGLGAAGLAQLFRNFHKEMYIFGGILMIFLGTAAFLGKGFSLVPMAKRSTPGSGKMSAKSIFTLGVFSGAATSCCAPVLAGAVALAVISGAFWKALIVTFAYVFGMTFPLFIAAYFYDKFKLENSKLIKGKVWRIEIGKKTFFLHSTNFFAGAIFLVMGAILLALAFSDNAFWSPSFQAKIGNYLNKFSRIIVETLNVIPDVFWGILIFAIFFYLIYFIKRSNK